MGSGCLEIEYAPFDNAVVDKTAIPVFKSRDEYNLECWDKKKPELKSRWLEILGEGEDCESLGDSEVVEKKEYPDFFLTIIRFKTSPVTKQKAFLMQPKHSSEARTPAAVIPFYNPESMCGIDPVTDTPAEALELYFGLHLVKRGYTVLCGQAFPFTMGLETEGRKTAELWGEAARKLLTDYPGWTGMGRLFQDTKILTDYIYNLESVDRTRIITIGHSLGGKMAFYAGCLDERVSAIIASDHGFAFSLSNWGDSWYLGDKLPHLAGELDHQHLLALHAPKPFLQVAGLYDGEQSKPYLNCAAEVYKLYGKEKSIAMINHAAGHRPTPEAMEMAYGWLDNALK